jgi:hypothetical protein
LFTHENLLQKSDSEMDERNPSVHGHFSVSYTSPWVAVDSRWTPSGLLVDFWWTSSGLHIKSMLGDALLIVCNRSWCGLHQESIGSPLQWPQKIMHMDWYVDSAVNTCVQVWWPALENGQNQMVKVQQHQAWPNMGLMIVSQLSQQYYCSLTMSNMYVSLHLYLQLTPIAKI